MKLKTQALNKMGSRASVGLAIGALAASLVVPAAAAEESPSTVMPADDGFCETNDGDHHLNTTVTYSLTRTLHIWGRVYAHVAGDDTGGRSNFVASVWGKPKKRVWRRESPDNFDDGEVWRRKIRHQDGSRVKTLRRNRERVQVTAWFDTFGSDPKCTAKIKYP